eukprot:4515052-Amphidinium_carterae.1
MYQSRALQAGVAFLFPWLRRMDICMHAVLLLSRTLEACPLRITVWPWSYETPPVAVDSVEKVNKVFMEGGLTLAHCGSRSASPRQSVKPSQETRQSASETERGALPAPPPGTLRKGCGPGPRKKPRLAQPVLWQKVILSECASNVCPSSYEKA